MTECSIPEGHKHQMLQMKGYVGNGVTFEDANVVLGFETNWEPLILRMTPMQDEDLAEKLRAVLDSSRT